MAQLAAVSKGCGPRNGQKIGGQKRADKKRRQKRKDKKE
jgi:hypothetical protein